MNRNLWIAVAFVAVLAIVIVVAVRPGDQAGTTLASPSPSTAASASVRASATAAASPTATAIGTSAATGTSAVYNDDFGFIVTDVGASGIIRKESSNARVGTINGQSIAVSPDGRQVAYFSVPASSPGQLNVVSAANPNSPLFSSSLSANERGGGIVWSNDGLGIAYAIHTGSPATTSTLRIVALGSGGPAQSVITWSDPGKILQPVAWDRATNVIAAGVTGDGGFMTEYLVTKAATPQGAPGRAPITGRVTMSSVRASSDAKLVLGVDLDSGEARFWPITDYAAAKAASGNGKTGALWRPGSHQIGFLSVTENNFVLFSADDGSASTPFRGAKAGSTVRTFRADGSAVVLAFVAPSSTGLGSTDYTLYRLSDGANVTFQDLGGLSASVRLR